MSFLDLQQVIQMAVTAPFILSICKDSILTLATMYVKEGEHHSIFRDAFFIAAMFLCISMAYRSWLKTLIVFKTEEVKGDTMLVYVKEPQDPATGRQTEECEEKEKTCKGNEAAESTESTVPSSPQPVKQSTTPPLANESNGPKED